MPVGVNGYCFHNSSLEMLLSLRDQSADWSWQSVPHAAGGRHPALRIKLNLCRAGPACPAGRVPWLTGGGLRAARPTDSRKIYASPGSGRRDAGPYRQKQKVLAVGPMWGANRAPPVAEEARRFRGSAPIGGHDGGQESPSPTQAMIPLQRAAWGLSGGGVGAARPTI